MTRKQNNYSRLNNTWNIDTTEQPLSDEPCPNTSDNVYQVQILDDLQRGIVIDSKHSTGTHTCGQFDSRLVNGVPLNFYQGTTATNYLMCDDTDKNNSEATITCHEQGTHKLIDCCASPAHDPSRPPVIIPCNVKPDPEAHDTSVRDKPQCQIIPITDTYYCGENGCDIIDTGGHAYTGKTANKDCNDDCFKFCKCKADSAGVYMQTGNPYFYCDNCNTTNANDPCYCQSPGTCDPITKVCSTWYDNRIEQALTDCAGECDIRSASGTFYTEHTTSDHNVCELIKAKRPDGVQIGSEHKCYNSYQQITDYPKTFMLATGNPGGHCNHGTVPISDFKPETSLHHIDIRQTLRGASNVADVHNALMALSPESVKKAPHSCVSPP